MINLKKVLLFLLCLTSLSAYALDSVSLDNVEKKKVEIQTEPQKVSGSITISDEQKLRELIEFQKSKDMEDIENALLIKHIIENNIPNRS